MNVCPNGDAAAAAPAEPWTLYALPPDAWENCVCSPSLLTPVEMGPLVVLHRNYLSEARLALESGAAARERLDRAGLLFWQAYVLQGGHWSRPLQRKADALLAKLLSRGLIKTTIAAMDDETAERLCDELAVFIEDCEQA